MRQPATDAKIAACLRKRVAQEKALDFGLLCKVNLRLFPRGMDKVWIDFLLLALLLPPITYRTNPPQNSSL